MRTGGTNKLEEARINIQPMSDSKTSVEAKNQMLELQLRMATSSINHEYARMEFDGAGDRGRREELMDYMHACHNEYFDARSKLSTCDPYALLEFETDLMKQKQMILGGMQA